ncbi:MAG: ATP-binding protein [Parcubacteria group bacterium]
MYSNNTQKATPNPVAAAALAWSVEHIRTCGCGGYGYVRVDFPVSHKLFGAAIPCICRRDAIAKANAERLRAASGLGAVELDRWTFQSFDPMASRTNGASKTDTYKAMRSIFDECQAYADDPRGWLILQGGVGTGKTHLAFAIAGAVLAQGHSVYAHTTPDLLDELRKGYNDDSYDARMDDLCNVGLLVLDDLGTERSTEWAAQALFQVINHRYSKRLPLVVTTNLKLEDARQMDARMASRLLEGANLEDGWTRLLTMPCADFRRKAA